MRSAPLFFSRSLSPPDARASRRGPPASTAPEHAGSPRHASADAGDAGAPPTARFVFTSSTKHDENFGTLAGADAKVKVDGTRVLSAKLTLGCPNPNGPVRIAVGFWCADPIAKAKEIYIDDVTFTPRPP